MSATLDPPPAADDDPTTTTSTPSSLPQHLRQTQQLVQRLATDLPACDLQWTLFVAAAQSFRYDSTLSPYPPHFALNPAATSAAAAVGERFDIETIQRLIRCVPPLATIGSASSMPPLHADVIELLHWVLCEHSGKTVRLQRVPLAEHAAVMARVPCADVTLRPMHIFRVDARSEAAEERFQALRRRRGGGGGATAAAADDQNDGTSTAAALRETMCAFHGSRLENFHSICAHGLQQHLCKQAMYGDGIYLSTEMHVSLPFSSVGGAWPGTQLGTELSCMAVCEFIDHEVHLKRRVQATRDSAFPEKYFVITNNDIVRVRYLLLFGKPCNKPPSTRPLGMVPAVQRQLHQQPQPQQRLRPQDGQQPLQQQQHGDGAVAAAAVPRQRRVGLGALLRNHKGECMLVAYALLLLFVGFINSRTGVYWRQRFWEQMDSWLGAEVQVEQPPLFRWSSDNSETSRDWRSPEL